jgi:hypothetical protein
MPDEHGNTESSGEAVPDTPLHAYKEGRKEDVSGDADALESNDPAEQQQDKLEGDDEPTLAPEKK